MEFKFGTMSVVEVGQMLSSKLTEYGIKDKSELIIYLGKDEFKKLDEDLFYRNKKNESDEFIPSEGEIDINFDSVKITVKEKN